MKKKYLAPYESICGNCIHFKDGRCHSSEFMEWLETGKKSMEVRETDICQFWDPDYELQEPNEEELDRIETEQLRTANRENQDLIDKIKKLPGL